MKNIIVIVIGLLLLMTIGGQIYLYTQQEKTAFFYNEKVFSAFKGTEELEGKLLQENEQDKKFLDSLALLVNAGRSDLKVLYEEKAQALYLRNQQQGEKYTADVWQFINEGVQEYGKENGYSYIFGATGDGGLMYAKEGHDITDEVIEYINIKYKSGN